MAARSTQTSSTVSNSRRAPQASEPPKFASSSTRIKRARRPSERVRAEGPETFFSEFDQLNDARAADGSLQAISVLGRTSSVPPASARVATGLPPLPLALAPLDVTIRVVEPPPLPNAGQALVLTCHPLSPQAAPSRGWEVTAVVLGATVLAAWLWLGLDYPAHLQTLQASFSHLFH